MTYFMFQILNLIHIATMYYHNPQNSINKLFDYPRKLVSSASRRRKMIRVGCISTVLILLCQFNSPASAQEDTVTYIVSLIKHLAISEPGIPKCVFYGLASKRPFSEIVEQILRSPLLDHVTKYVVSNADKRSPLKLPPRPLLMIVDVGDFVTELGPLTNMMGLQVQTEPFQLTDPTTKLLVLLNATVMNELMVMNAICKSLKFARVVYLDSLKRRMFYGFLHRIIERRQVPDPEDLFLNTFSYVEGGVVSIKGPIPSPLYPEVKWVQQTAQLLNASALLSWDGRHDIKLEVYRLAKFNEKMALKFDVLLTSTVDTLSILVPRDRLDIMQLFMLPFDWEVWFVIILLLLLSEAVRIFFPSVFRNDPILLVVCGFERYDLNRAGRWEKMFLHSLMVLTFFTTCAYETKIIELMINRPSSRDISTIEDLIKSGIKVQAQESLFAQTFNDSDISELFLYTSKEDTIDQLDGIHAFLTIREYAEFLAPFYYDESQRRSTYSILQEPLQVMSRAYTFPHRSPLRDVFAYSYQAFVESGIRAMLYDRYYLLSAASYRAEHNKTYHVDEDDETLDFEDITPAWIALALGLFASCVILMGEVLVELFTRKRNRVENNAGESYLRISISDGMMNSVT